MITEDQKAPFSPAVVELIATSRAARQDPSALLNHLVNRYSTAEQAASYVLEGALDTEVRVIFTHALDGKTVKVSAVGKTIEEAADNLRAALNKPVEEEPKAPAKAKARAKVAE